VLCSYATRVNAEFQALGARGVSIMFSSGDGGVAGSQPSDCPNGFIPTFPAASPYVTAVGATDVPSAETAAQFSTGGFSNYWGRPPYQVPGVARYLQLANASGTLPAAHYFNQSGIGFPDVAAIGTNFDIVCFGTTTTVDGTSCSSPTFAGMVALLNDHRLAAGKATLGWLNPLIWKTPSIFKDITTGNNPGCGTNGFTATQGWDPITGWGSLDYQAALKLVMSLP
jgi:tripeptidyl-peptidase-1